MKRSVRVDVGEFPHLVLRLLDLAEASLHSRGRPLGTDRIGVGHVDVHNRAGSSGILLIPLTEEQ